MDDTGSYYETATLYHNHEDASSDTERGRSEGVVEWTPGKEEWRAMITMAIVSLMVALDATILVPALPVSTVPTRRSFKSRMLKYGASPLDSP